MSGIEWVGWIVTEPHPDLAGEEFVESDYVHPDRGGAEREAEGMRMRSPHRTFRVMRVAVVEES